MKKFIAVLLAVIMVMGMVACGSTTAEPTEVAKNEAQAAPAVQENNEPAEEKKFLIGMSQCNLGEPWRVAMNNQIAAAAEAYPEFEVVFADAAQDNAKQVADVENFITQQVDLLIISPNEAAPLTDVVAKAYDAGIPVIVLDRKVEGDKYTQFIGGDNVMIGKKAGEYVANYLGEEGGTIVEIRGLDGSTPAQERHDGFVEGLGSNPNIEIVYSQSSDWLRDKAMTVMEAALQAVDKIDVVYGHNDPSAIAAYYAADNAGRADEMIYIGIDGLPDPDGGIQDVIAGRQTVTYVYPTGGAEAIASAYQILVEGKEVEKTITLDTIEITAENAEEMLAKFGG